MTLGSLLLRLLIGEVSISYVPSILSYVPSILSSIWLSPEDLVGWFQECMNSSLSLQFPCHFPCPCLWPLSLSSRLLLKPLVPCLVEIAAGFTELTRSLSTVRPFQHSSLVPLNSFYSISMDFALLSSILNWLCFYLDVSESVVPKSAGFFLPCFLIALLHIGIHCMQFRVLCTTNGGLILMPITILIRLKCSGKQENFQNRPNTNHRNFYISTDSFTAPRLRTRSKMLISVMGSWCVLSIDIFQAWDPKILDLKET